MVLADGVFVFGHTGGIPVEELLPLAPGGAALAIGARALVARLISTVNRRGDAP